MNIKIILVKSFSDNINWWNPTWVIYWDSLTQEQMQKIASVINFSEIVFVLQSDIWDYKFRFFSPIKEVDICAHALIWWICSLTKDFSKKSEYNIETNSWIIKVVVKNDLFIMEQKQAEFLNIDNNILKIAELLWLKVNDFLNYPIQLVSTWTPKLMIPLKSKEILFSINPNFEWIKEYCKNSFCRWFYPFSFETIESNSDIHARQFNPLAWINEDPITWIAAWALWAYLLKHWIFPKKNIIIEQWYIMNKFWKVFVEVLENKVNVWWKAIIYWEDYVTI